MKGIFLVLIFLILGVVIGVVIGVVLPRIQEYFLRKKVSKKATETKKNFQYKDKVYDIKQEIERQLIEFNKMKMNKRKKRMKGGNKHNGNTIQSGRSEELGNQGTNEGIKTESPTADNPTTTTGNSREESGQVINRNLLKRGRKFN